jgi:hypothetical protein
MRSRRSADTVVSMGRDRNSLYEAEGPLGEIAYVRGAGDLAALPERLKSSIAIRALDDKIGPNFAPVTQYYVAPHAHGASRLEAVHEQGLVYLAPLAVGECRDKRPIVVAEGENGLIRRQVHGSILGQLM